MSRYAAIALALLLSLPARSAAQLGAVMRGRVVEDSTSQPIREAAVSFPALHLGATTDNLGRFRLADIPSGNHEVQVRRLGYAPFAAMIRVRTADSLDVEFILAANVQSLPNVEVATKLLDRKLVDFNERRRYGIGHFLDSTDVARASGTRLSEKLRHLPGLIVSCRSTWCTFTSSRGQQSIQTRGRSCPVALGLDGVIMNSFSVNDIHPGEVAGIEWYAGPAQMPARFNGTRTNCGLLMIWTR